MSRISQDVISKELRALALEASELYADEPVDYKGRRVTPTGVTEAGEDVHHIDVVIDALENTPGGRILDVGMAYGVYDVLLQRRFGFEVYGIDHPDNLAVYCRFPIEQGLPVLPCDLHVEDIPYPANYFDTVIASEIVEHLLLHPKALFLRLHTVLKPGGHIIVTTPNVAGLSNILSLLKGRNPADTFPETVLSMAGVDRDPRVHPREYTVQEIQNALVAAGFEIHSIRTRNLRLGGHSSLRSRAIRILTRFTPRKREKIVAIGRKV